MCWVLLVFLVFFYLIGIILTVKFHVGLILLLLRKEQKLRLLMDLDFQGASLFNSLLLFN